MESVGEWINGFGGRLWPKRKCSVPEFVEETDTLRRFKANESAIILEDFNALVGNDPGL